MHVYEVIPGISKFFPYIVSLKTYNTGYFRKQQSETCYFCGMTLAFFSCNANQKIADQTLILFGFDELLCI